MWSDRRIIRVQSEEALGEGYEEGKLTERQFQRLIRMIEGSRSLMRGNGGLAPVDADAELYCLRTSTRVVRLGETVPRERPTDLAKLKAFLLGMDLHEVKGVGPPWVAPAQGWYK